ncbi:MAG TPA: hypothetical protein VF950_18500 [Planctomycetota bacterium]
MLRLLPLLLLLAPAQDPAELIRKLEDDAFDVREQAQADLVKLGEAALPALRKSLEESKDRAELRVRVQAALREIDLAQKSRTVCPEPKLVTLALQGPLRRLLEEVSRQTELKIESSAVDAEAPAALDVRGMPALQVLDLLCRGSAERRWEFVDDDRVRFLKEPQPAWPTSYTGSFRVRTTSLKLTRATDFKAKTSSLRLVLEADHDKRVKPARGVDITVTQAEDDKGSTIEARKGDDDDAVMGGNGGIRINRGFVRMQVAGGMEAPAAGETITLKGLDPAATRVSFRGTATFRFPLDRTDVRFAPPQAGETRDAADLKLKLETLGAGRWKLNITKSKPDQGGNTLLEDVQQRLDLESLVGLDDEGTEHKGTFQPGGDTMAARIVVVNGVVQQQVDGVSYLLQLPTLRGKTTKEIRFKFADRVLEKKIPFAFENVPLP